MTVERLTAYRDAGADGGFVPGLASAEDAAKIVAAVPSLAINVMAMPGLASLDALAQAGVRRISAGPAFFRHASGTTEASEKAWLEGDYATPFAQGLDYARRNAFLTSARRRVGTRLYWTCKSWVV